MSPLAESVAAVEELFPWGPVRFGLPTDDPVPWVRCADVDNDVIARWEADVSAATRKTYDAEHPQTATAYVLDYYTSVPGYVGGLFFAAVRRVPRLGREFLAFRLEEEHHYVAGLAVLDPRFWCLPSDPAADHPDAVVVPDEAALAALLRREIAEHAGEFLPGYRGGAKLPKRNQPASFYDSLDAALEVAGDDRPSAETIALGALVLPAGDPFLAPSSLYELVDCFGGCHAIRRRISCCYHYKLGEKACLDCTRNSDEDRQRLVDEEERHEREHPHDHDHAH